MHAGILACQPHFGVRNVKSLLVVSFPFETDFLLGPTYLCPALEKNVGRAPKIAL
jgi:hypothetical protein